MPVPYTFASATAAIPLSNLDSNFATAVTIGNTAVQLGNTITNLTGVTNVASGSSLTLQTNGSTTAVTIDTSQNVGIGTTSPNKTGYTSPVLSITNGTSGIVELVGTQTADGTIGQVAFYNTSSSVRVGQILGLRSGANNSGAIAFQTNNAGTLSEVGRFDSSGNLLVGTSTDPNTGKSGVIASNGIFGHAGTGGAWVGNAINFNWTGNLQAWVDTTNLGTIAFTSDYRLKENVVAQPNPALTRVMQLEPVQFNRKTIEIYQGSNQVEEGFIADKLQSIIPSAVDGVKDGLTSDGKIQPQTINILPIVSVLTKAIQELSAQVTTLQSQVAALQAKVGA